VQVRVLKQALDLTDLLTFVHLGAVPWQMKSSTSASESFEASTLPYLCLFGAIAVANEKFY
jgi:hypothetical protein